MKTTLSLALCLAILTPSQSTASTCDAISWGSRQSARSIAISGDQVWLSHSRGTDVWSAGPGSSPSLVTAITDSFGSMVPFGTGVAGLTGEELVLTNQAGHVIRTDSSESVLAASGDLLVTGGTRVALWRYDGNSVTLIDEIAISGRVASIAFDGSLVAAAIPGRGLWFARVSSGQLHEAGRAGLTAHDVVIDETMVWAVAGATGLIPIPKQTLTPPAGGAIDSNIGNFTRVVAGGNRLFVIDEGTGIRVYERSGDAATLAMALNRTFSHIAAADGFIAAIPQTYSRFGEPVAGANSLEVYESSDGALLRRAAIPSAGAPLEGMAVRGDLVFITDPPLLRVLRRSGRELVEISSVSYGDASNRVILQGDLAIAYGRGDAHLITISNPYAPRYEGVFRSLGTSPNDVAFAGSLLLETNRGSGFHILDVSNRKNPVQIGGMINDGYGQYQDIAATPRTAYGSVNAGVKVVDLTDLSKVADPWTSRYERVLEHPRTVAVETVIDRHVPLLTVADFDRVFVYSLEDELDPTLRSVIESGEVRALGRVDGEPGILIALASGEVVHVNLDVATQPREVERYEWQATQVHGDAMSVGAANGSAVTYLPRQDIVSPALAGRSLPDGRILLEWNGPGAWELHSASNADFSDASAHPQQSRTSIVGPEHRGRYLRGIDACGVASDAIRIEPALAPVTADETQVRLIGRDGERVATSIAIRNRGQSTEVLEIDTTSGISASSDTSSLAPGGFTQLTLEALVGAVTREELVQIGELDIRVRVEPLVVSTATPDVPAHALILPGVGLTPGARETMWRSDVDLMCDAAADCDMVVVWLGPGVAALEMSLSSGEGVVLSDVGQALGISGSGALAIWEKSGRSISAGARTYNDAPDGTYGQRIEATALSDGRHSSDWYVPAIVAGDEFRTNIGIAAPVSHSYVEIVFIDSSGSVTETRTVELQAHSTLSVPVPGGVNIGSALVKGSDLIVWASRVDQTTGDASFVRALPSISTGEPLVETQWRARVDQAGRTTGAAQSRWNTDLMISNSASESAQVTIRWIPAAGGAQATRQVTIDPGATVSSVLDELLLDPGLGSVSVESGFPVAVVARAYLTREDGGTFGQLLPTHAPASGRAVGREALFPLSQSEEFRTNLYLAETAGRPASAIVEVLTASGRSLTAHAITLEPWESRTINSFLREWQLDGVRDVQLRLHSGSDSRIRVVASVVAGSTSDGVSLALDPH